MIFQRWMQKKKVAEIDARKINKSLLFDGANNYFCLNIYKYIYKDELKVNNKPECVNTVYRQHDTIIDLNYVSLFCLRISRLDLN
jgi:hypothetical protein